MSACNIPRVRSIAFAATVALATMWSGAGSASDVLVAASIEVADFAANLEAAGQQRAETGISAAVVELVSRHFPVLGWTGDAAVMHVATLGLAMVARAAQPQPAVSLIWRGNVADRPLVLPQLQAIELYSPFQFARETHDADRLVLQVREKLNAWFAIDANRQAFSDGFLRHVPVATQAQADDQARGILLPISLASARMDGQSKLTIRLVMPTAGAAPEQGEIRVSNLLARGGADAAITLGRVQQFNVGDAPGIGGENIWDPQIPAILLRALTRTVFVEQYKYSELGIVVDGLAQEP